MLLIQTRILEESLDPPMVAFMIAGRVTVMETEDWLRLLALPRDARLVVGARRRGPGVPVLEHRSWGRVGVARLLLGVSEWERAVPRDGDPFNLLRRNLKVIRAGHVWRHHPAPTLPPPVALGSQGSHS